MKKVFLAVIAVIVVLAGGLMLSYNGLAGSKEAVETAEADVDTMLQRRADLIPNLVSTVKSYTKHETGVVDRIPPEKLTLFGQNFSAISIRP